MTGQLIRCHALLAAACLSFPSEAATAHITVGKPETCGNSNGEMNAYMSGSGSVPPYTYLWSTGATTQAVTGVPGGNYSVTITDALGTPYVANATVESFSTLPFDGNTSYGPSYVSFYDITGFAGGACDGLCNGMVGMPMVSLGGTPPFTVDFSVAANYVGLDTYGFPYYSGFCGGDLVSYTITDALGCQGSNTFTVFTIDGTEIPTIASTNGACVGSDIGSFTLQTGFPARYSITDAVGNIVVPETTVMEFQTETYDGLPPGTYTLDAYPMLGQCLVTEYFEVPDLGPGCTKVEGDAWFDQDADCVQDIGEVGVPGSVMVIQPGTQYAVTGGNGHFSFNLPAGNYTIAQTDPTLVPYCPVTQPVPFTVNGPIANIEFANNSTAPLDLRAHINSGFARPGFPHNISGAAVNSTVQVTGTVEVTITIDPTVEILSATPTPTTTAGNVLTWNIAELDYFGQQGFSIETLVPVSTPLGTELIHSITVSSANSDADPSDNADVMNIVVEGSYDPNDKTAFTSSRSSDALYFIAEDEWIDYTIRFQNTGTAEAFFVTITDTLPEELDMTSFQMALASHAHTYTFKPGRVVEWFFDDIMLPDSTTDLAGSQGFVKFRIRPVQPLLAGTLIENIANIYFDFNPPVITEPSVLVAEFSTGVEDRRANDLRVYPNPAGDVLNIEGVKDLEHRLVDVLALDGRSVFSEQVRSFPCALSIVDLTPGAYWLQILAPGRMTARTLFIKQ